MHYQIWTSRTDLKGHELLNAMGLGDHTGFDSVTSQGPAQSGGTLFAWLSPDARRMGYRPDEQTWIPSLASGDRPAGEYWVGIWNSDLPKESDLRKPEARSGAWITFADGQKWLFPSVGKLERFPEIKDGKLTWVVDQQFSWYVNEVEKRRACLTFDDETPDKATISWDLDEDFEFIVRSLRLNYRLTPEAVVYLRMVNESTLKALTAGILGFTLTGDSDV